MRRPYWMLATLSSLTACPASNVTPVATIGPAASASPPDSSRPLASSCRAPNSPQCCDLGARSCIWGVTIDDPWSTEATVDALRALPVRATARIVFDASASAADYRTPVVAIHGVSDVMGELLDSMFVAKLDIGAYARRAKEYLDTLGPSVDLWEIGNEVNGEWLGSTSDVVAKISAAYDEVKRRGRRAALTLYYNEGCSSSADHEVFTWASTNVPLAMRQGLDYVLLSYYDDDCGGRLPDWPTAFRRLAQVFPTASLGFGECGTARKSAKESFLTRYYGMRLAEPRFVGGYFWWYFSQDMVPRSKPLWSVLSTLMAAR